MHSELMTPKSSSQEQKGVPQGMAAESSGRTLEESAGSGSETTSSRDGDIHNSHYCIHWTSLQRSWYIRESWNNLGMGVARKNNMQTAVLCSPCTKALL